MNNRLIFTLQTSWLLATIALLSMPEKVMGEQIKPAPHSPEIAVDYCENFASKAGELRFHLQMEELEKLNTEIDNKLQALKERTEALQDVIKRRDDMINLASGELLKIYSRMEVEPAARQLEKIDTATAASVLRRLKPQLAGEILAAMDVKRSSQLVQFIATQDSKIEKDSKS